MRDEVAVILERGLKPATGIGSVFRLRDEVAVILERGLKLAPHAGVAVLGLADEVAVILERGLKRSRRRLAARPHMG